MIQSYKFDLKNYPFENIKQKYPQIQRKIYDTLLTMTPSQLLFELNQINSNKEFSLGQVDEDTFEIIGIIMSKLMDNNRLVMTKDDVIVSYLRFKELIFLHSCVSQGLMKVQVTDKDIQYVWDKSVQPTTKKKPGKRYRCRL
jgi:hypothetical protein